MFDTIEKCLAKLREDRFPPIFERLWLANEPRRFAHQWKGPHFIVERWGSLVEKVPALSSCVPLLEANLDQMFAYNPDTGQFLHYYYGDLDVVTVGQNYQQFLSWLFVDLGYAGLTDLVESVASEFGYSYLDEFLKFMESDDDQDAEMAKRNFVNAFGPPLPGMN